MCSYYNEWDSREFWAIPYFFVIKRVPLRYQKEVFRSFTMVIQFGITMLVPILLCTFLGIFLDRLIGTSFIVIILFFFGALAGFTNIFKIVKNSGDKKSYIGSDAEGTLKKNVKSQDLTQSVDDKRNS